MRNTLCATIVFAGMGLALNAQDAGEKFFRAIRNANSAELKQLIQSSGPNVKDERGTTALMNAAAFGSLDSMKMLIDAGSDVNAKNAFDATALMWCAGNPDKVKLLLAKGADVNVKSKLGRTALLIAASVDGNSEAVRALLDRGADADVLDRNGASALGMAVAANDTASTRLLLGKGAKVNGASFHGGTPLIDAASNGNLVIMKLLLDKGADVNAASSETGGEPVKNGHVQLGRLTPLHLAVPYAGPEAVKLLLDAGAKVDALDIRGMTPLMLAISTDRADPRVIKMLLAKGCDRSLKSKAGETAADWAMKFNNPGVMDALGLRRQAVNRTGAGLVRVADPKPMDVKPAVEKSLALLQKVSGDYFNSGGCAACHAQNLTNMASVAARANGYRIIEPALAGGQQGAKGFYAGFLQPLLQFQAVPVPEIISYQLVEFGANKMEPGPVTDVMVNYLLNAQSASGSWHVGGIARPPMEDGDVARTVLSMRALQFYNYPGRKAEIDQRIGRAAAWIKEAKVVNVDDRNMKLAGLQWAGADRKLIDRLVNEITTLQLPDGGWAQTRDLASDAFATGQTLAVLHEAGIPPAHPAYQRGVAYLLKTQAADGSWLVKSRAPKFQPYFQSGFPYDHDQWISMSGTAWSVMGLVWATPKSMADASAR